MRGGSPFIAKERGPMKPVSDSTNVKDAVAVRCVVSVRRSSVFHSARSDDVPVDGSVHLFRSWTIGPVGGSIARVTYAVCTRYFTLLIGFGRLVGFTVPKC